MSIWKHGKVEHIGSRSAICAVGSIPVVVPNTVADYEWLAYYEVDAHRQYCEVLATFWSPEIGSTDIFMAPFRITLKILANRLVKSMVKS